MLAHDHYPTATWYCLAGADGCQIDAASRNTCADYGVPARPQADRAGRTCRHQLGPTATPYAGCFDMAPAPCRSRAARPLNNLDDGSTRRWPRPQHRPPSPTWLCGPEHLLRGETACHQTTAAPPPGLHLAFAAADAGRFWQTLTPLTSFPPRALPAPQPWVGPPGGVSAGAEDTTRREACSESQ